MVNSWLVEWEVRIANTGNVIFEIQLEALVEFSKTEAFQEQEIA